MRTTILALLACLCAACAAPVLAQSAPPAPPGAAGDGEGTDDGGVGYIPGAQFQRKLDGGPGFVCSATNALNTARCTASCRKGESADCVDADGTGAPSCACTKG